MKALLISCYGFHYDIRFRYVKSILEKRGYQVKMVFSNFDHIEKQHISYSNKDIIGIKVPAYKRNISIKRLYSHIVYSYRLRKVLALEKPDFIFADIPPNTIGMTVAWYKSRAKECKVIFDVLDLWPESFSKSKMLRIPFWFWRKIRTSTLPKGDYVTLECDLYKKFLSNDLIDDRYSTLYLCKPSLDEMIKFSHHKNLISFAYLGSMNNIIDISAIIKMLVDISKSKSVKIYLVGDGERREYFVEQLDLHKIDFEYLGLVFDEKEKNEILRKCHFGINMYNDNVNVGLTMKSLDYFRVGLPTVNMNIYDTGILVTKYQSGFELTKDNWKETVAKMVSLQEGEWEELHENTMKMFQDNFSEAVFTRKFIEVLERCGI
jgi:glycosyltransferase involved in cell wall biosynthesis